jgi:hypothetical protein
MAEQVGGDADLLGCAVGELGHGAIPEQMRPDRLPEGLLGVSFDLLPDRGAAHGATVAIEPKMVADTADLALGRSNQLESEAVDLKPAIDVWRQLEENGGTTQAVPAARSRATSSAKRFVRVARAGRTDDHRGAAGERRS